MAADSAPEHERWITDEELIQRLSHRPHDADNGMINITEQPQPFKDIRDSAPSSIGSLDSLPVELVHTALNRLDFQSLSRFSQTSLRANSVVQTLTAYRDMMKYAPKTLAALGQTRLVKVHSAATLHRAIQSWECVSCAQYGAYLFLPTCERCCWWCLSRNQSLWVIPREKASESFALSEILFDQMTKMLSIPGDYSVGTPVNNNPFRLELFSVKVVKRLAMSIYGDQEAIAYYAACLNRNYSLKDIREQLHYLDAPLERLRNDPLSKPGMGKVMEDPYCGMASMPFPYLRAGDCVENGLWCIGCDWAFNSLNQGQLSEEVISQLVPRGLGPVRVLTGLRSRSRSRAGFLEHIKNCYGVQNVGPQLLAGQGRLGHEQDVPTE